MFGRHKTYLDGNPRPLFRGYLHGFGLISSIILLPFNWIKMKYIEKITGISIITTLFFSSALHLYPWKSIKHEIIINRLDRASIIGVNSISFSSLQFTDNLNCRPNLIYTLITCIIPNFICLIFILFGKRNILIWSGSIISSITTSLYIYTIDIKLFNLCCITLFFYGVGLYIFTFKPFEKYGDKWGSHEWFHLMTIFGFIFNMKTINRLSIICS